MQINAIKNNPINLTFGAKAKKKSKPVKNETKAVQPKAFSEEIESQTTKETLTDVASQSSNTTKMSKGKIAAIIAAIVGISGIIIAFVKHQKEKEEKQNI